MAVAGHDILRENQYKRSDSQYQRSNQKRSIHFRKTGANQCQQDQDNYQVQIVAKANPQTQAE